MNKVIIDKFKDYFIQMDFDKASILKDIYSNDVMFTDPIHGIYGIEKLSDYFNKLNGNLIESSFQFIDESTVDNKSYLSWEMDLKLKKLKRM
jgi:hypothetical protein